MGTNYTKERHRGAFLRILGQIKSLEENVNYQWTIKLDQKDLVSRKVKLSPTEGIVLAMLRNMTSEKSNLKKHPRNGAYRWISAKIVQAQLPAYEISVRTIYRTMQRLQSMGLIYKHTETKDGKPIVYIATFTDSNIAKMATDHCQNGNGEQAEKDQNLPIEAPEQQNGTVDKMAHTSNCNRGKVIVNTDKEKVMNYRIDNEDPFFVSCDDDDAWFAEKDELLHEKQKNMVATANRAAVENRGLKVDGKEAAVLAQISRYIADEAISIHAARLMDAQVSPPRHLMAKIC